MEKYCLEICCGTASDAGLAALNGADRIELNAALPLGGLTPSCGSMEVARSLTDKPVLVMIRPRPGDFCYDEADWRTALSDAKALLRLGADGLVFGCLLPDGRIDAGRVREMLALSEGRACVFHRAFDQVPDWKRALELLIGLGVRRILSAGGQASAADGTARLAEMVRFASGAIEILPGGGVRPGNVRDILRRTGCRQAHLSAGKKVAAPGARAPAGIRLGEMDDGRSFTGTDPLMVAQMRAILDSMEETV